MASPHWSAAKADTNMLTPYFAQQRARCDVTVNAVCPCAIPPAKARLPAPLIEWIASLVPRGRFAEPSRSRPPWPCRTATTVALS